MFERGGKPGFTPEKAWKHLRGLGYEEIEDIPTGPGFDMQSALVAIAKGEFGREGVSYSKVLKIIRTRRDDFW